MTVSLTSRGRSMIDKAIQLRLNAADEGLRGISARDRKQLAALLRKVVLAND